MYDETQLSSTNVRFPDFQNSKAEIPTSFKETFSEQLSSEGYTGKIPIARWHLFPKLHTVRLRF